jgi:hypothetical protein
MSEILNDCFAAANWSSQFIGGLVMTSEDIYTILILNTIVWSIPGFMLTPALDNIKNGFVDFVLRVLLAPIYGWGYCLMTILFGAGAALVGFLVVLPFVPIVYLFSLM